MSVVSPESEFNVIAIDGNRVFFHGQNPDELDLLSKIGGGVSLWHFGLGISEANFRAVLDLLELWDKGQFPEILALISQRSVFFSTNSGVSP